MVSRTACAATRPRGAGERAPSRQHQRDRRASADDEVDARAGEQLALLELALEVRVGDDPGAADHERQREHHDHAGRLRPAHQVRHGRRSGGHQQRKHDAADHAERRHRRGARLGILGAHEVDAHAEVGERHEDRLHRQGDRVDAELGRREQSREHDAPRRGCPCAAPGCSSCSRRARGGRGGPAPRAARPGRRAVAGGRAHLSTESWCIGVINGATPQPLPGPCRRQPPPRRTQARTRAPRAPPAGRTQPRPPTPGGPPRRRAQRTQPRPREQRAPPRRRGERTQPRPREQRAPPRRRGERTQPRPPEQRAPPRRRGQHAQQGPRAPGAPPRQRAQRAPRRRGARPRPRHGSPRQAPHARDSGQDRDEPAPEGEQHDRRADPLRGV